MARIVVECSNPNDLEAIVDAVELAAGKCPVTYFKQAKKLQEVGAVKSERAAARKIAEETGESPESVRQRIIDGKRSVVLKEPKESKHPETIQNPTPVIIEDRKPQGGGTREGAGRPRKEGPESAYYTESEQFVMIAISQLGRIRKEDPEAITALLRVKEWIEQRIKHMKGE